jgi:hypothetical protein
VTGRSAPGPARADPEAVLGKAISDGQRLEAFAEQQTREMHTCQFCERIGYHRLPMKPIGRRWVCIDCIKSLKETLDSLDRWEQTGARAAEVDPTHPWGVP